MSSEAAEIAQLNSMGISPNTRRRREDEIRARNRAREKDWNSSIAYTRPPMLRGLKPMTPEPWAKDEAFYQKTTGSFEPELNSKERFFDESPLDNIAGYKSQVTATGLAKTGDSPSWDSSTFRSVPYALRGIKPITREPWAVDQQINRDADFDSLGPKEVDRPVVRKKVVDNRPAWDSSKICYT